MTTKRLTLRPHTALDYQDSARLWANPAVVRHITGAPSTPEESWARILRYMGHWQALGYGYWAVMLRSTGQFIGEVGFANYRRVLIPPLGDTPEAGWMLMPRAQGLGYAREAVTSMHRWADSTLKPGLTACILDPGHAASKRLAVHVGYHASHITRYKGQRTLVMHRPTPKNPHPSA